MFYFFFFSPFSLFFVFCLVLSSTGGVFFFGLDSKTVRFRFPPGLSDIWGEGGIRRRRLVAEVVVFRTWI